MDIGGDPKHTMSFQLNILSAIQKDRLSAITSEKSTHLQWSAYRLHVSAGTRKQEVRKQTNFLIYIPCSLRETKAGLKFNPFSFSA